MSTSDRPRATSWFPDGAPAPPRTLDEAVEREPAATLAVIGAPRAVAAVEVRRALERGLDVLVVGEGLAPQGLAAEAAFARDRGLLLLAGDALIDGTAVREALIAPRPGPVGIVAADLAAAAESTASAERAGYGASHVLVVDEGDLRDPAGGAAALSAIARLGEDPATTAIALSGAGDTRVLRSLNHACVATGKPAVVCAIDGDARRGMGWEWIGSMAELPRALVRLGVDPRPEERPVTASDAPGVVLGALSAPSAAHEVIGVLLAAGLDVASNVPRPGVLPEDVGGHTVVALASPAARAAWLRSMAAADHVRAVVLDLPATSAADSAAHDVIASLAAILGAARAAGRAVRIGVSRPRGSGCAPSSIDDALVTLGAEVCDGAAAAARAAMGARSDAARPGGHLRGRPLSVITLGADDVAVSLAARGVPVLAIAWSPPGGGDPRLARLVGLLR